MACRAVENFVVGLLHYRTFVLLITLQVALSDTGKYHLEIVCLVTGIFIFKPSLTFSACFTMCLNVLTVPIKTSYKCEACITCLVEKCILRYIYIYAYLHRYILMNNVFLQSCHFELPSVTITRAREVLTRSRRLKETAMNGHKLN